jgi:transposase
MDPHELRRWAAAYYEYIGWSRKNIEKKLGCDRGTVSRLLKEARERGYLT